MSGKIHKKKTTARLLQIFQAFSLDVVIGSLAMGVFAIKILHVQANPWWWPVLALSVWVVYTGDHLVDGYHRKQAATMFRHRIHYQYRYLLILLLILAATVAVVLVWMFMDRRILVGGIILGLCAMFYLGLVYLGRKRDFYFQKEFFISLFYVAGIWLAPDIWYGGHVSFRLAGSLVILLLFAWAEGLLMAFFEQEADKDDKTHSFCTYYGAVPTRNLSGALLLTGLFFSMMCAFLIPALRNEFILMAVLSVSLIQLLAFSSFFKKEQRYRLLGELSFWLPFILLI